MAHAVATLANNGIVMRPHLVKMIEDPQTHVRTLTVSKESARIPVKQVNVDFIKNAMAGVVKEGTARSAFAGALYEAAGKTGTAQVIGMKKGEKYNASKIAMRFRDHAWFTSFAPVDKPKIAIAIIVENAGFGAESAAPIVRKALDYYLLGKRPSEKEKDLTPVEHTDPELMQAESEAKAEAESEGGPPAGKSSPPPND